MRYFSIIFIVISIQSFSQNINTKIFDTNYNDSLIIDYCNISTFKTEPYNNWFFSEYNNYTPTDSIIEVLKYKINNTNITIILGIWCSDSRQEFPRFIKILDLIKYDYSKLTIIAVDTYKNTNEIDIYKYNIKLVPTFILYKNTYEIGRIIETPEKSLEKDLLNIITIRY